MDYSLGDPYTYDKAVEFCDNNGMSLCSRDQYCNGGQGGTLFGTESEQGGMQSGDKWAPVSDNYNSWIETGTGAHTQCWTHTELGFGAPSWGTTGLSEGFGRRLCCHNLGMYLEAE